MTEKGLGRIHKPDHRDLRHTIRAVLEAEPIPATLPKRRYAWTPPRTFPLDQGQLPHCVAYSSVGLGYCGPIVNMNMPDTGLLYREAQLRDEIPGTNYDGTTARGAMDYLREIGLIESYKWCWDVETLRLWHLVTGRPAMGGFNWYSSYGQVDRDGFIRRTPTAQIRGGHEVLFLGWDDVRGAERCMNSWGIHHGDRGRFWMAGEELDRQFREDADVVTPIEKKATIIRPVVEAVRP